MTFSCTIRAWLRTQEHGSASRLHCLRNSRTGPLFYLLRENYKKESAQDTHWAKKVIAGAGGSVSIFDEPSPGAGTKVIDREGGPVVYCYSHPITAGINPAAKWLSYVPHVWEICNLVRSRQILHHFRDPLLRTFDSCELSR